MINSSEMINPYWNVWLMNCNHIRKRGEFITFDDIPRLWRQEKFDGMKRNKNRVCRKRRFFGIVHHVNVEGKVIHSNCAIKIWRMCNNHKAMYNYYANNVQTCQTQKPILAKRNCVPLNRKKIINSYLRGTKKKQIKRVNGVRMLRRNGILSFQALTHT